MNIEALALLETPTVRRLVATWPNVKGASRYARIAHWARISGVYPQIAGKWYEPLMQNGVIKEDGTVDELASEYIGTIALTRAKILKPRASNA